VGDQHLPAQGGHQRGPGGGGGQGAKSLKGILTEEPQLGLEGGAPKTSRAAKPQASRSSAARTAWRWRRRLSMSACCP